MYYRSQGYHYPKNVRIPINYSGNAFTESNNEENNENSNKNHRENYNNYNNSYNDNYTENSTDNSTETTESVALCEPLNDSKQDASETEKNDNEVAGSISASATHASKKASPLSLFGNIASNSLIGRIGSEEILILALVFLLSDSESEGDIIWLLLLLLFIK